MTSMQIFVETLSRKTITFRVNNDDTIKNVKKMIQKREGIPWVLQRLLNKSMGLEDERTLRECGITDMSKLQLVLRINSQIIVKISIDDYLGHRWPVPCNAKQYTLLNLKQEICRFEKDFLLIDRFDLVHKGNVLKDNLKIYTKDASHIWGAPNAISLTLYLKEKKTMRWYNDVKRENNEANHQNDVNDETKIDNPSPIEKDNALKGFLNNLRMENYYQAFKREGFVDLNIVKEVAHLMNETHLEKMGVDKIAHRLKLLNAIRQL